MDVLKFNEMIRSRLYHVAANHRSRYVLGADWNQDGILKRRTAKRIVHANWSKGLRWMLLKLYVNRKLKETSGCVMLLTAVGLNHPRMADLNIGVSIAVAMYTDSKLFSQGR